MRNRPFLIERDINEEDLKTMFRWKAIHDAEVKRIANVCNYWERNPLRWPSRNRHT